MKKYICSYTGIFNLNQFLKDYNVLILPIKKQWFDLMVTGEKTTEFRKPTKFIKSRLIDKKTGEPKHYDYQLYVNGYGWHLPYFICKHEGYGTGTKTTYTFSDNSILNVYPEDYNIFLGDIKYKSNIKKK